jgi:predicted transcriptional regulator
MEIVVADFETHTRSYVQYGTLIERSPISRIMLDVLIEQAMGEGLLTQDGDKDVRLTAKGKQYAIVHKLIK